MFVNGEAKVSGTCAAATLVLEIPLLGFLVNLA